jgi:hypothetical protein
LHVAASQGVGQDGPAAVPAESLPKIGDSHSSAKGGCSSFGCASPRGPPPVASLFLRPTPAGCTGTGRLVGLSVLAARKQSNRVPGRQLNPEKDSA